MLEKENLRASQDNINDGGPNDNASGAEAVFTSSVDNLLDDSLQRETKVEESTYDSLHPQTKAQENDYDVLPRLNTIFS